MRDVYACQLELVADRGVSPSEAILLALDEWMRDRIPGAPAFDVGKGWAHKGVDGAVARWEPFEKGDCRLLEFTLKHADTTLPSVTWTTSVSSLEAGGRTKVLVRVLNSGPPLGAPGCLLTTRPRFVVHLSGLASLRTAGTLLKPAAVVLGAPDIATFVRYELYDRTRQVPILVLTPHPDGSYEVPPDEIARDFLSLGKVCCVPVPTDTFALTDEVGGKRLSCFGGALRVYMPGFSRATDPTSHPLLLPRTLSDRLARLRLAQKLAAATVYRFEPLAALWDLRDERALAADSERHALLADIEVKRAQAKSQADYEALFEMSDDENEKLAAERDDWRQRCLAAEQHVDAQQHRIRQLVAALRSHDSAEAQRLVEEQTLSIEAESVLDAVQQASEMFQESLLFAPSAFDSAGASPYLRPSDVLKTLKVLADVSDKMRAGPLGRNLKDVFAEFGIRYKSGLSETTSRRLRSQYEFAVDGRSYSCEEHLCLGGEGYDPGNCLRIHFCAHAVRDGRMVVGYVGRHLDVMTTT